MAKARTKKSKVIDVGDKPTDEDADENENESGDEGKDEGKEEGLDTDLESTGTIDVGEDSAGGDADGPLNDGNDEEPRLPVKREAGSISRRDPLSQYMSETRRYPLLTPQEEHDLAVKLVEHGDTGSARKLIEANLRLVVKIAYEYRRAHRNLLDLVQEGNIGPHPGGW